LQNTACKSRTIESSQFQPAAGPLKPSFSTLKSG
jgi:hypothetical protein